MASVNREVAKLQRAFLGCNQPRPRAAQHGHRLDVALGAAGMDSVAGAAAVVRDVGDRAVVDRNSALAREQAVSFGVRQSEAPQANRRSDELNRSEASAVDDGDFLQLRRRARHRNRGSFGANRREAKRANGRTCTALKRVLVAINIDIDQFQCSSRRVDRRTAAAGKLRSMNRGRARHLMDSGDWTIEEAVGYLDSAGRVQLDRASEWALEGTSPEQRAGIGLDLHAAGFRDGCRKSGSFCRSEERRVGKECRSRWSPYH